MGGNGAGKPLHGFRGPASSPPHPRIIIITAPGRDPPPPLQTVQGTDFPAAASGRSRKGRRVRAPPGGAAPAPGEAGECAG